jgi:hypothetical protein
VLVLDAQDRLVDINPATQAALGLRAAPFGQSVEALLTLQPRLTE